MGFNTLECWADFHIKTLANCAIQCRTNFARQHIGITWDVVCVVLAIFLAVLAGTETMITDESLYWCVYAVPADLILSFDALVSVGIRSLHCVFDYKNRITGTLHHKMKNLVFDGICSFPYLVLLNLAISPAERNWYFEVLCVLRCLRLFAPDRITDYKDRTTFHEVLSDEKIGEFFIRDRYQNEARHKNKKKLNRKTKASET